MNALFNSFWGSLLILSVLYANNFVAWSYTEAFIKKTVNQ